MPIPNLDQLLQKTAFPGMLTSETEITKKFLQRHALEFDRVDFDVPVGQGGEVLPNATDAQKADHKLRTQKKIDCMVWTNGNPIIVEAKQRLDVKTLGQCLGYALLWHDEHPDQLVTTIYAVAYDGDQDSIRVLTGYGVTVEIYER